MRIGREKGAVEFLRGYVKIVPERVDDIFCDTEKGCFSRLCIASEWYTVYSRVDFGSRSYKEMTNTLSSCGNSLG
jgi:hypothetical protein